MRDQRHVHDLLNGRGGEEGEARGAGGHDVRVVAEDGQRMRRDGTRGNMENRRRQFAGNLEHVRDHEEQALRGGERRG